MGHDVNRLDWTVAMRYMILDAIGAFMLVFGGAFMIGVFSCLVG